MNGSLRFQHRETDGSDVPTVGGLVALPIDINSFVGCRACRYLSFEPLAQQLDPHAERTVRPYRALGSRRATVWHPEFAILERGF